MMSYKVQFHDRLLALQERQPKTFPQHVLPEKYASAAVLLLFWPGDDDSVKVVLTRRTETVSNHRGQVCFPGGGYQAGDVDLMATALRETEEELGVKPALITIMGRLDDAFSIAGHHVIPYVGWAHAAPQITPDRSEVAEVIIGDVAFLSRPEVNTTHEVEHAGMRRTTHAFDWEGGHIWGLTADILLEFFLWLRDEPSDQFQRRLHKMNELDQLKV